MDDAKKLWTWWQSLLGGFSDVFTGPGWVRFVQWVTGMVLCWEEHTITQILTALGLESRWRVLESFAEYGAWDRQQVERHAVRLIEREQSGRWGRYRVQALDDTKLHRSSPHVWGTCTFHEYTARSPNRAETVRAHNWVVQGDLVPGTPWTYLPHSGRLYVRKNQRPAGQPFRTKTDLAAELLRQADTESAAPLLGVFDGAYAVKSVIQPCVEPKAGQRRIEILTRLRVDARLYAVVPSEPKRRGPRRKWGRRQPAPRQHAKWGVAWKKGAAWIYGQQRKFRYKQQACRWSVSGPHIPVHVFVFEVEGFDDPWFMVTTAIDLTAAQVVAAFAARFRQEDGFRDHKQRLGMEECRAWTKEPVLRTFQVQMIAQTLLRLMQFRLDAAAGADSWWQKPAWNPRKCHASLLDLRRLFWRHRAKLSQLLGDLEEVEQNDRRAPDQEKATRRAA